MATHRFLKFDPRVVLIGVLAGLVGLVGSTSARAAAGDQIEGVWSFGGGAIAIAGLPNGTFQGTVVKPTKFATCEHQVGELIWTAMRLQADGSYVGLHQWFRGGDRCEPNPQLGKTAWRVAVNPDGTQRLEVCFSNPGDASQPTIPVSGPPSGFTFGCDASSPLAALPAQKAINFDRLINLPPANVCRRRHRMAIGLHNPKYDPLKEVIVRVKGKKVRDITDPKKLKHRIVLRNLPDGSYRVRVIAVTVLGERVQGSRRYHACTTGKRKVRLHAPHAD